jgi:hypothetical protein
MLRRSSYDGGSYDGSSYYGSVLERGSGVEVK